MPFILASLLLVGWVAVTGLLCWMATREAEEPTAHSSVSADNLQKAGLRLTICTACVVVALALLPGFFRIDTFNILKWIHHVGVVLLGAFLAAALYFQLEIHMKVNRGFPLASLRHSYQRWRELTEVVPAPAAIMILVSGMALVYARSGFSVARGWIFTLIVALAVMMADGIFAYSCDLRRLLMVADLAVNEDWSSEEFVCTTRNRGREIRLFLHSLSYPFVVIFPAFRICDSRSPVGPIMRRAGIHELAGWSQLWPSLVLFVIPFLTVASLNRFGRSTRS